MISKLWPSSLKAHLNYHVVWHRIPSGWQLLSGLWPWWRRLFGVKLPVFTVRLSFLCGEIPCCYCAGNNLHYVHLENSKSFFTQAVTFVPPLSDQKIDQNVQWSPKRRKFCICVTATAQPLCVPWTTNCCSGTLGRAKEAEWRQNHYNGGSRVAVVAEWRHSSRHTDRSVDTIGRLKEAQWWYKGGRSIAQIYTQS